jgi:hypothetical protein
MSAFNNDEMHIEAVQRMKLMCVHEETIRQFAEEGLISKSEPPFGAFYWVNDKELDEIRSWEAEHGACVYMVVRSYTTFGTMDSYLYVSRHKDEWEADRELIKEGQTIAYVINRNDEFCSEIGSIGIRLTPARGLVRTW